MTTICHFDTGVEAEKYVGHFFKGLGVVGGGERETTTALFFLLFFWHFQTRRCSECWVSGIIARVERSAPYITTAFSFSSVFVSGREVFSCLVCGVSLRRVLPGRATLHCV